MRLHEDSLSKVFGLSRFEGLVKGMLEVQNGHIFHRDFRFPKKKTGTKIPDHPNITCSDHYVIVAGFRNSTNSTKWMRKRSPVKS